MKSYIYILLILFISCKKENPEYKVYQGKKLEISYNPILIKNLKDQDYIEINGIKYIHKENIFEIKNTNNNFILSFNNVVVKKENKTSKEEGNIVSISRSLISKLTKTNNYILHYPQKNSLIGKVVLSSKNNKPIKIIINKNYPAKIKILEIQSTKKT